jgi:hypothetical protein
MKLEPAETAMFARLATEPKLHEWLNKQLQNEYEILVNSLDKDYTARAQGRAGLLRMLMKMLDDAKKAS